jgi:hypothetical protein
MEPGQNRLVYAGPAVMFAGVHQTPMTALPAKKPSPLGLLNAR